MTQMEGTNGRTPDDIQREIEDTRTQMDHTIEAIKHQLTPGGLLNEAMHHAGRLSSDVLDGVGRTVRQNPLPAAVIGAGVIWLLTSESRRKSDSHRAVHAPYPPAYGYGGDSYGPPSVDPYGENPYGERARSFGGPYEHDHRDGHTAKRIEERVTHAAEGVKRTGHRLAETADRMGERVSHAGHVAMERSRYGARRARTEIAHVIDDQPLVLVAVGLGVGALLGALLPGTSREDRVLGPHRDRAMRKAKRLGEEGLERAKTVSRVAADAVTDALETELKSERTARGVGTSESERKRSTQQYGSSMQTGSPSKTARTSSFDRGVADDVPITSPGADTSRSSPYANPTGASVRGSAEPNAGEASTHVQEIHSDPMTSADSSERNEGPQSGRGS